MTSSVKTARYYRRILRITMMASDVLFLAAAWIGSYYIREMFATALWPLNPIDNYLKAIIPVSAIWVLIGFFFGLYKPLQNVSHQNEMMNISRTALLGFIITSTFAFYMKGWSIARSVVLIFGVMSPFIMFIGRSLFTRIEKRLFRAGFANIRCLIIGAGETGIRVLQKIQDHPDIGYEPVGFVDDHPALAYKNIGQLQVLGTTKKLKKIILKHRVEEVFMAVPKMTNERILDLIVTCDMTNVRFKVVSNLFEVISTQVSFDVIDDIPLIDLKNGHLSIAGQIVKRSMDLILGTLLLILSSPVWLAAYIAIKRDSKGPVLFRQTRVGKDGVEFECLKFRTMRTESDPYEMAPGSKDDPRVTRVGRKLRDWSIDELPQLINVLKGDMSLVGPRPEMPFIVARYKEWERRRLEVQPGITGLWQIIGRKDLPLYENMEYDFYYIMNQSVLLDILILLRTVPAVLKHKGAY